MFRILIAACLLIPMMASAGDPEDYRFPRELGTTKDGYPLPLTCVPITKPPEGVDMSVGKPSKAQRPGWLSETMLPDEP